MAKETDWEYVGILMIAIGGIGLLQGVSHIMGIGEGSISKALLFPLVLFTTVHLGEVLLGVNMKKKLKGVIYGSILSNSLVFGSRIWVNGILTQNFHSSEIAILSLIALLLAYILFKILKGL
jgi:hypothetical protein